MPLTPEKFKLLENHVKSTEQLCKKFQRKLKRIHLKMSTSLVALNEKIYEIELQKEKLKKLLEQL